MRNEARSKLANGTDPGLLKQEKKRAGRMAAENSFEAVAREWCVKFLQKWTEKHSTRVKRQFEKDIFPWIGKRPIAEIEPQELFKVLQRIEKRGAIETAHRKVYIKNYSK